MNDQELPKKGTLVKDDDGNEYEVLAVHPSGMLHLLSTTTNRVTGPIPLSSVTLSR